MSHIPILFLLQRRQYKISTNLMYMRISKILSLRCERFFVDLYKYPVTTLLHVIKINFKVKFKK